MAGGADELNERYRSEICSTVLTSEYTGDLQAILSSRSERSEPLKSLIHQISHIPVTQEVLVFCQKIQLFSTACHDFAVKIFWT